MHRIDLRPALGRTLNQPSLVAAFALTAAALLDLRLDSLRRREERDREEHGAARAASGERGQV